MYAILFMFRDNVSWDEAQEAEARLKVESNTKTKVSEAQQSMCMCSFIKSPFYKLNSHLE